MTTNTHDSGSITADEALARLVAGNERFIRGEARFPTVQKEVLADLARGQRPYVTILGCSTALSALRAWLRCQPVLAHNSSRIRLLPRLLAS